LPLWSKGLTQFRGVVLVNLATLGAARKIAPLRAKQDRAKGWRTGGGRRINPGIPMGVIL